MILTAALTLLAVSGTPVSVNAGTCPGHEFYTRDVRVISKNTSQHRVGTNIVCTITTTGYECIDVCKYCGMSGRSYADYRDSHSVCR